MQTKVKQPTIMITGATGFLGCAFLRYALKHNLGNFVCIARNLSGRKQTIETGEGIVQWVEADLIDQDAILTILSQYNPDYIYHFAGRVRGSITQIYEANAVASAVLADSILQSQCTPAVQVIGSAAEYGRPELNSAGKPETISDGYPLRPIGAYGNSKLAATQVFLDIARRGVSVNIIRPFNLIGEINSIEQVVGSFIAKLKIALQKNRSEIASGVRVDMASLGASRDFITVESLNTALVNLIRDGRTGLVINACSGRALKLRTLLKSACDDLPFSLDITEQENPRAEEDIIGGDPTRFNELLGDFSGPTVEEVLRQSIISAANQWAK